LIHFKLLAFLCFALYLAECFLWVPAEGWIFLSWFKRFSLVKGPTIRFRNPWPMGFTYRFEPDAERSSGGPNLSIENAKTLWGEFQKSIPLLKWFSRALLAVTLSAFLLFVFRRGFMLAWGLLFFIFVFAHLSIVQSFWRAYPKLYPGKKVKRIKRTLLCLVSPWQSARALDLLGDDILDGFHPLVAAKMLLENTLFLEFSRRWMLDLRYPDLLHKDHAPRLLLGELTAEKEDKSLSDWLSGQGVDLDKLLKPLEASHPSHLSFCQRCDTEYGIPKGKCSDCGRDLVPFPVQP